MNSKISHLIHSKTSQSCGYFGSRFLLSIAIILILSHAFAMRATAQDEEISIPEPENISLETKDSVKLKCTFFGAPEKEPGKSSGKKVAPFILVHDWEGSREDLLPFAAYLQGRGFAVIVPDLRGHGGSTALVGSTTEIDYSKFRKSDFSSVVKDIERCKKYLVQRNNDGELNIDMLNIVAIGKSAAFAVDWTISDWSWPNRGSIKQGQDVKSLILISPQKKMKSLNALASLKHPLFSGRTGVNLPTIVVWSDSDESCNKDSKQIFQVMKKGRPDLSRIDDDEEVAKKTTLYKVELEDSTFTGTELIHDAPIPELWSHLADFVDYQVGSKSDDYTWQSRKKK